MDNRPQAEAEEVEVLLQRELLEDEAEEGAPRSQTAGGPMSQAESLWMAGHNMRHQTSVAGLEEFGCPNSERRW